MLMSSQGVDDIGQGGGELLYDASQSRSCRSWGMLQIHGSCGFANIRRHDSPSPFSNRAPFCERREEYARRIRARSERSELLSSERVSLPAASWRLLRKRLRRDRQSV
ncbi:hypothetical protein NW767_013489 [Fusarium falciforme]|nr:hypothetical protein NW767_013489 [Fusarium falciforme]